MRQHAEVFRRKFVGFAHTIIQHTKTSDKTCNRSTTKRLFFISLHCFPPCVRRLQELYFVQPCFVRHILFYTPAKKFIFHLRRLPPHFQCTSTTMARLLELLVLSFITKFMFTSVVLCSPFACVKHFVEHFHFHTVIYIVYHQHASGLHFKPLSWYIADNQCISFTSFTSFICFIQYNFNFCYLGFSSIDNFAFCIHHSSPRILFSSHATSGPHERYFLHIAIFTSCTIFVRIFSSTTSTISATIFTSPVSCTFATAVFATRRSSTIPTSTCTTS